MQRAMPYQTLIRLWNDESGVTTIEYGLIAMLVSLAGFAALGSLGDTLGITFGDMSTMTDRAATTVAADNARLAAMTR